MKIEELMAITGAPGLYRIMAGRKDGIVAENLETGNRKFFPTRKHVFSPLESISLYVQGNESTNLKQVISNMIAAEEDFPVPDPSAGEAILFEYLGEVLPDYDPNKVHHRDVKKLTQWYVILKDRDLLSLFE